MPRVLGDDDAPALEAFLAGHAASSMVLRSNARAAGLVDRGEPLNATYVATFDGERVTAVVAHCWNGLLLRQCAGDPAPLVEEAVAATGRPVLGFLGPWEQVVRARHALGLDDAPAAMDSKEDLFDLDLRDLRVPDALARGDVACRRAADADVATFASLQHDYAAEALGEPPGEALMKRQLQVAARQSAAGDAFVLESAGAVVACSTFNARLPDCVQVGGVFVPPPLRSRGFARAVVAGSLRLARAEGATRAILFTDAANAAARTAYLSLGFRIIGDFGIVLLTRPVA